MSLQAQRRFARGLRVEALEDRRLMATGPQLVGIQPNEGALLTEGQTLDTAPRDLSLLFSTVAGIDVNSLPTSESDLSAYDSIQITRSGLDGTFERALVFSDFNTKGAVQIEFKAVAIGQAGNAISIAVTKAQLEQSRVPEIEVVGSLIQVTLNARTGYETRASDLVSAINADAEASALVTARVRAGVGATNIATPAINYSPLTMVAANVASVTSSFNAGSALAIQFTADQQGAAGNALAIQVTRANLGLSVAPTVSVSGTTISVVLNSNTTTPTTAQQLVTAVNGNAAAAALVTATLRSGDPDTLVGNRTINYSPLTLSGANDVRVELGYLGLGDSPRQVIVRFAETLPDDVYMIEILGGGPTPLVDTAGNAFQEGSNFQLTFELNLAPQIMSVIPQPVVRSSAGVLSQQRNVIEVYFNDDDLDPITAQDPRFYQLIHTNESVTNTDDTVFYPTTVSYSAAKDMAVLTFSQPLETLAGPGTYRLRIGTDEAKPNPPSNVPVTVEPGSSFATAMDLTTQDLGANGLLLSSSIRTTTFVLDYPGGNDEPGHRDIEWIDGHLLGSADGTAGISTIYYNFQDEYGVDPQGQVLHNAITETQKQRAREVFSFYGEYLGVKFIESATLGFTIVTGDLRALDPTIPTGEGGVAGVAGSGLAIMDLVDFDEPGDDVFGGSWFQVAMHEIGHLLGLGHTYELPALTIMGDEADLSFGQAAEGVFPGDQDIAHGQYLFRPESNDVDLYEFQLTERGVFSAETIASRQADPSLLDSVLTLYRATVDSTGRVVSRELIARNDDYYNTDSFLQVELEPGTYYVGVSANGNMDYDPAVEDSGSGGLSQGNYQLRLNFRPAADRSIVDATGVAIDGDGDGVAGGVYNYWFRAAAPVGTVPVDQPRTIFVDKAAASGGNGSLAAPFKTIPAALAAAKSNDIVRLLGNPGADKDITTLGDNLAYQIGYSRVGGAVLEDGATLEVPQGVTLMIDANAILKFRRAYVGVGSLSQGVDRSGGTLQVLGAPRLFSTTGSVLKDRTGQPIAGSVYFTSLHDKVVGKDNNPDTSPPAAQAGDWGGIIFRNDLDIADSQRLVYEQRGIFLDYVNNAVMSYGGGSVVIAGVSQVVTPVYMIDARPTVTYNTITRSSDAAMSANPDSFEEDNFHAPKFQGISFTSDYDRVGPDIHNNTVVDNSLNGLFIRVTTAAGQDIEKLTKSARWDDTDIVHIVAENLTIEGQAGGPILEESAPAVNLVTLQAVAGGTLAPADYEYKIVFVDAAGNEGPASEATDTVSVSAVTGAVLLKNLPKIGAGQAFVARRIYRAVAGTGRYERVAQINALDTKFLDIGYATGIYLDAATASVRARLAGRLAVDPGTIVKLDRSRIDAAFGAQLIAEGVDGHPVVFTSLHDDRYGFGGTFDTAAQQGQTAAAPGDWSGLYLGHLGQGSIDFAVIAYAGGTSRIEGTFAGFNAVEIHQSEVRIANSKFEFNADGLGGQAATDRGGRGPNDYATIFIRGAQPVFVSNTLINNAGAALSINVNALNATPQDDVGRTTGTVNIVSGVNDNTGPLVRLNRLDDNTINGMIVRGGTLTTQSVWDDTDIVHVVRDEIIVPDFHTYGGLRLESSPQESLVVKLDGSRAGFTATGQELEIEDRIGGSVQIVGQPRFPVILTSLADNSVGAGYTPGGLPQTDTLPAASALPSYFTGGSSQGSLTPRPDVIKPPHTVVDDRYESDVIVVKFQDGLKIRVSDGALVDRNAGQLGVNVLASQDVQAVLNLVAGGQWERMDSVAEETLDTMRQTAQQNLGRAIADLNLYFYLRLPAGVNAATVIDAFNTLGIVELAQPVPRPVQAPSSPEAPPVPQDYTANQGYLNAAPTGIGALGAWASGTTGAGVRVVDIEYTFNAAHLDLPSITILGPTPEDPGYGPDHGTAVFGEMAALDNGWGVTGIAPDANYYFAGAFTNNSYLLAEAITVSIAALSAGDVILLEQQIAGPNYDPNSGSQFGLVPVEWYQPYYERIVTAVGNGIIVVEAAGNGSQNLDDPAFNTGNSGHYPFQAANDSGAIIVGAGAAASGFGGSDTARSRLYFSNYGSTVDLQGWGEQVWTTGYGDAYSAEGANLHYTSSFGGTSSASPIVTGAVALLQSAHKSSTGGVLSPAEVIQILRDGGTPQQSGTYPVSENIGPLPNLGAAAGVNPASPGDWRSVRFDELANDRNVDVVTEREPSNVTTGADNNEQPGSAQFMGWLAPNEKAGDDTLRLGFEIHGVVSAQNDVDVYSFRADAGTEVWFDIDRTTGSLDSVVELIDANGNIIAQSDDSYAEQLGELSLYSNPALIDARMVNPLRKSAVDFYPESALGEPKDLWSTNVRDAGMRVVLPGAQGTNNTYYVRVRSSNILAGESRTALQDPAKLNGGLTSGVYQLQARLQEIDEVPGSTVQYADIRYATNGIEVFGQPNNSPLTGEASEVAAVGNDALAAAQALGNLLTTDQGVLAVGGSLSSLADLDFYRFEIGFDSIQNIAGFTNSVQHLAAIFDIDYADGLARPNTNISIFDANGRLILFGGDSNIADDQPAALNGTDMDDLSRGSAGVLDPYIGTQELPVGTYYLAISSAARIPQEFDQFYTPTPVNPLLRLEPVPSVARVVEDHIDSGYVTTATATQIPVLFDNDTAVPYTLGDVVLFVSRDVGGLNSAYLNTVDPFTGVVETAVDRLVGGARTSIDRDILDIAMRSDGTLWAFTINDPGDGSRNDTVLGNFLQINTGDASTTNVGDDGIATWQANENLDGEELQDVGYRFNALTFADHTSTQQSAFGTNNLFAVGDRIDGRLVDYSENVLYMFNSQTGAATSDPMQNRPGLDDGWPLWDGGGTQIIERGFLDTSADPLTADTMLILTEATEVNQATGTTTFLITDGLTFTIDDDDDPATGEYIFEFNSGPEIRVRPNPSTGAYASDGDVFVLDGKVYEFDTGSVIQVLASNGSQITDGSLLTITDNQPFPVTRTFEFDKNGVSDPANVRITINNGMQTQTLMTQIVNAINGAAGFAVTAESLPNSNRITLRGESDITGAVSTSLRVAIVGEPGVPDPGRVRIPIEETSDLDEYGTTFVSIFNGADGITAGWDGQRVNFSGAGDGDFTQLVASGLFVDMGSDGAALTGINIPFLAQDTAQDLAARVQAAILLNVPAPRTVTVSDRTVELDSADPWRFTDADSPLRIAGGAPGGTITGIAFVGTTMYAVTNTGGLFRVNNAASPLNATATYVASSAQDLQGIRFSALCAGPIATQGGDFATLLFGMDSDGTIFAFDTAGILQNVLVDGQSSVETGLTSVHGLAFSTLDENPWGIVNGDRARAFDTGHGLEQTFDMNRYQAGYRVDGGASLHFGRTRDANLNPITYNWPGGAHGSMESYSFSLEGYSATDKPVMYFSYYAATEQESSDPATQTPMLDALRVYISNETGGWDLLASNDSYTDGTLTHDLELDDVEGNSEQELYDLNNGWRQVRVELDAYAGRDDLQIRIDFATAGTVNTGDADTAGSQLRMVPGAELSDGQTFEVDGDTFEIDMGYTLVVPSGAAIQEHDTLNVTFGATVDRVFEFVSGGAAAPGNVAVTYYDSMTPGELTAAIEAAIRAEFPVGPTFRVAVSGNRINLPDADDMVVSAGSALALVGSPGAAGLPVALDADMLATEVVAVVQQALADRFANGTIEAFRTYDSVVHVIGHTVTDQGPFGLTDYLPGEMWGDFNSNLRGQDNAWEGIYLDDFIIGFAERGEIATNASGNTNFYANPELKANQILTGAYELEVRQSAKYGESLQGPDRLELYDGWDTNDRLSESYSLIASPADEISDGQTFALSDGLNSLTFEFDDVTINNGVTPGNVRIPFDPMVFDFATGDQRPQTAAEVAASIRDAINSSAVQAVLDITAALADGTVSAAMASTNSVVNLTGNVDSPVIDPVVRVTSTTMDGNQLRDELLGGAFTAVGDAIFTGSATSAGFFTGGGESIGISSGIVLTTGDARYVEGPNNDDGSTGIASDAGDADLDTYFAPFETLDTTSLEFSFQMDNPGDLFFEFVFSSEEYNEFVDDIYNDVFAFFVDGVNIGLVPGSFDPVTINTVNGGNPYGGVGANAEYYNNNDRDDDGLYLDVFGHDGFTDVFVARMEGLAAGVHTIKLAISDVGDTALDSAVFIRAFNATGPDPRTQIRGEINNAKGDTNILRDQGQTIIHSNTVSNSLRYGIVVGPGDRTAGNRPYAGPVRVTRQINTANMVPGVVVTNNLLVDNQDGGISIGGDPNAGTVMPGTVPFARVLNNTVYGGDIGIRVQNNASPTLLNNIVADTGVGISIDGSSSTTVVGGTVYAGPGTPTNSGNLGAFAMVVADSDTLFVNEALGNFYLKPGAAAIDSSVDSLLDRNNMITVRQPLGIPSSPILAPALDLYGQQRVDDPAVASPSGLGQNVFKDRGAIDRSDFAGPTAMLVNPRDNDAQGADTDTRDTFVELKDATLFYFSIQLIDGVPPSDESYGSGADRNTVLPEAVSVTRDGDLLEEGVDYRFSYDATSGVIRLTPLAGIWETDHAYEIQLQNVDTLVITARSGEMVADGNLFTIEDLEGDVTTFEFESGYVLTVPATGGAGITDGSTFSITRTTPTGTVTTTFEFDRNSLFNTKNKVIRYTLTDTADKIAGAIATAITNASIGLSPVALEGGIVHVGGTATMVLNTSNSALTQSGTPGVTTGNIAVPFVPHESFTAEQMAVAMASAINGAGLTDISARAHEDRVIVVGAASIGGVANRAIDGIKDLAGNILQPNRFDGTTAFTIFTGSGYDYGDAPETYPVLKVNNGARHEVVDGFMLGDTIFATVDGQPSSDAGLDPGDDGVVFGVLTAGYGADIAVVAHGITAGRAGYLDAWIDFNADGDWNDAGEQIFDAEPLVEGVNSFPATIVTIIDGDPVITFGPVVIPSTAVVGTTFARVRFSSTGGLSPTGPTADGEVEDYQVTINANPWQNPLDRRDVNVDTYVSPIDALLIINLLNFNPGIAVNPLPVPPDPGFTPPPYYDVNGDGYVSPADALAVINFLNGGSGGEGEGEGEGAGLVGGYSLAALVDSGLDTGLVTGQLLVAPDTGIAARGATAPAVQLAATAATPPAALTTGLPASGVSVEELAVRLGLSDLQSEDLEDLLDDLVGETDGLASTAEAHAAVFARFGA